eukprot:SAG22_NODE_2870_length_2138_cov_1.438450_2_plen_259_part_00
MPAAVVGLVSLAGLVLYLSISIFLMPGEDQMGASRCQDGEYSPLAIEAGPEQGCRPCGHCAAGNPTVEACGGRKPGVCAAVDRLLGTSANDALAWSPQNVFYAMPAPPPPPAVLYDGEGVLDSTSSDAEFAASLLNDPSRWAGAAMCQQRLADARRACCAGTQAALSVGCDGSIADGQKHGWWAEHPLGIDHCTRSCQSAFGNFTADCAGFALFLPGALVGQPGSNLEVTISPAIRDSNDPHQILLRPGGDHNNNDMF